jgi:hypothetical protein
MRTPELAALESLVRTAERRGLRVLLIAAIARQLVFDQRNSRPFDAAYLESEAKLELGPEGVGLQLIESCKSPVRLFRKDPGPPASRTRHLRSPFFPGRRFPLPPTCD